MLFHILDKHKRGELLHALVGEMTGIGKPARRRQHGVLNQESGGLRLNPGYAMNLTGWHCMNN